MRRKDQDPSQISSAVDLQLDATLATSYSNRSQIARVVTEAWVRGQVYCPACDCDSLAPTPTGTKVVDFSCDSCDETYQLKSQKRPIGSKVTDAAFGPMMERLTSSSAPSFLFLHYRTDHWQVIDLFFVPRFFLSPSVVERRRALGITARRAGWVGCNILLSSLPVDARIPAVRGGSPLPREAVRDSWRRFAFLRGSDSESRGWTADVLACVREVRQESFRLADVYRFEGRLARVHPRNRNIRPKIRQQLQVLRDHGVLEFLGRGRYRVLLVPSLSLG